MTDYTEQKLAEEVALELARADAANPAESPEDIDFIKRRYRSAYEALEDVAFWDLDAIPDRAFIPMAQHVAFSCRNAFGAPNYDPRDDEGLTPQQKIRRISSIGSAGYPTVGQYY